MVAKKPSPAMKKLMAKDAALDKKGVESKAEAALDKRLGSFDADRNKKKGKR